MDNLSQQSNQKIEKTICLPNTNIYLSETMDIQNHLNSILTNKGHHQENKNRVFKTCGDEWIAVMEKCVDTITNESRSNVADPRYAKFRANKLKVLEIFNKFDCSKTIDEITNTAELLSGVKRAKYKVGEDAVPDSFDDNLDSVCSNGIHYFKTLEPAFYFSLLPAAELKSIFLNGTHKSWYENGNIMCEVDYKDGKRNGPWKYWHGNGNIACEGNYVDGCYDGLWKDWHHNNKPKSEANYKDDKLHGPYKAWYGNGNIKCEGNFVDGNRDGLWKYWYDNNRPQREENYVKGVRHGLCRYWFLDEDIVTEQNYVDGRLVSAI